MPTSTSTTAPVAIQPLKSISVPNAGVIPVAGLTVVVGPNSSGKTRLLRDIYSGVGGDGKPSIVCTSLDIEYPNDFNDLIQYFKDNGQLATYIDENGHEQIQTTRPHIGMGSQGWRDRTRNVQGWYEQYKGNRNAREFSVKVGALLVTSLFLDRRLSATNQSDNFDWVKHHPNSELQALHMSPKIKEELTSEISKTFGKSIWLDHSRGNLLCLRVSDSPDLPSAATRLEPALVQDFRTIESEGDGLKSYTCICMSLLLGRTPIQLIDEPEMCLHPPQAYALGRFIGQHATRKDQATFVATHSSHLLRGIVEATSDLRILRITRTDNRFHGKLIPYATIKACIERPSTKAETILDGVFAEAVTIVESEGDRIVYTAAEENIAERFNHDMQFVSVGGLGGVASTASLYRQLEIPQVAITDLDLIANCDMLQPILEGLGCKETASIVAEARTLTAEIRALGPRVQPSNVQDELKRTLGSPMDWAQGHDDEIKRTLGRLASNLSRTALLKEGGLANFKDAHVDIHAKLAALLARCRKAGLFMVPVGVLEFWEPDITNGISKRKKAEWANEAALRIRSLGKQEPSQRTGIHDFMAHIFRFQQDVARNYAGYPVG